MENKIGKKVMKEMGYKNNNINLFYSNVYIKQRVTEIGYSLLYKTIKFIPHIRNFIYKKRGIL